MKVCTYMSDFVRSVPKMKLQIVKSGQQARLDLFNLNLREFFLIFRPNIDTAKETYTQVNKEIRICVGVCLSV